MGSTPLPALPEKHQSLIIPVLRWIAVLPASAGAFVGIQLLIILGSLIAPGYSDWYLQLINSAASAYCFVYAGARTAPAYQFIVGIVLAVFFGIMIVGIAIAGFFIKTTDPLWWLILAGVISLIAAIVAVVRLSEDR
jgi:hypothetical protein